MGWGCLGARARVILHLRVCIWNAPAVSLGLPMLGDTGHLVSSPFFWFHGSTLGDCLPFPCEEYGD